MADEYGFSEKRRKKKDKKKARKRFPYRKGGAMRSAEIKR